MDKKKVFVNLFLLLILITLVCFGVFFYKKADNRRKELEAEKIVLKDIDYGSEVSLVGFANAKGILNTFIEAYNTSDGKKLASIMNLVGTYIYSEYGEAEFDKKYEEILAEPSEYKDFVIMQYSLKKQEEAAIKEIDSYNVQVSLVENSEIEDVTKYLSKMTAKIRTVSEADGVDQIDELEFLLLHRDGTYYVMDYVLKEESFE